MTRRAAILAICLALAAGLLGTRSWTLALGRVERHAIHAVEQRTGFAVTSLERVEFAVLPLPRISLSGVGFAQRDGSISGQALRLRGFLRLLPLLTGQIDFDRIDLVGPQLDIAVPAGSESVIDWLAPPLAELEKLTTQSRIVIRAGSLFLRAGGAIQSVVRDVDLVIGARERNQPFSVAGAFNWRGTKTEVNLVWPVIGGSAKASLSAMSPLLKLRFDGTRSGPDEPFVTGTLSLSAPSLPRLLGWFGENSRLADALGAVSLNADLRLKPHEASFNNAAISLDGERLDGVMKLAEADGRMALSGTLAGSTLDLGRMIERLPLPAIDGSDRSPFELEGWTGRDVDLRISVDAARLKGARLADVATYVLVKRGRFETGLLRAAAYGGTLKGRLLAMAAPAGVDVKIQAAVDKVNLGQAGADVPALSRLSGTGGMQLALDGAGRSFAELVGALSGRAGVQLRQGEITGVALTDLLKRAERGAALPPARETRQSRTDVDTLSANAGVANGLLVLTDAQMSGTGYRLGLAGSLQLRNRELDMTATLAAPGGASKAMLALKGPIEAPFVAPPSEAKLNGDSEGSPLWLGR